MVLVLITPREDDAGGNRLTVGASTGKEEVDVALGIALDTEDAEFHAVQEEVANTEARDEDNGTEPEASFIHEDADIEVGSGSESESES